MRHFDLSPLYRSTIGFDRLASMLEGVAGLEGDSGFPPYNIERTAESKYRISMAVAGFARSDITVEVKETTLTVRGAKKDDDKGRTFLHRGIASRAFERRFQLADHVEVVGADLEHGLLHIDLERRVPERLKPRTIAIGAKNGNGEAKFIDGTAAAGK
jgi:molecular chaperone IbpA